MRRNLTRVAAAAVLSLALAVAGCGGDDDESAGTGDVATDENGFPVNAHMQPHLGVVPEGIELDGREGTPPAAPAEEDLDAAADAAGCELEIDLPHEGSTHFTDEDQVPDYRTSPPTSGDHYGRPEETLSGALADGAYLETPPVSRAVHSLEHGRVIIQYSPDLSEDEQLALKGLFDESPEGMLIYPNPDMPYAVAATAWQALIGCEEFAGAATIDAIAAFRAEFRGHGPEKEIPLS